MTMRRRAGLTLAEIILSSGILAFVVLTIVSLFSHSLKGLNGTRNKTMAAFLAQEKMEEVIYQPAELITPEAGRFRERFDSYRWRVGIEPHSDELNRITVTVRGPRSEEVSLTALKRSKPGWITFASNREGASRIFMMDSDGRRLERLTSHPSGDSQPCLFPDGRTLAFVSYREKRAQIFTLNLDECLVRQLTKSETRATEPAVSPDGRWIAFTGFDKGFSQVFVMAANGEGQAGSSASPMMRREC